MITSPIPRRNWKFSPLSNLEPLVSVPARARVSVSARMLLGGVEHAGDVRGREAPRLRRDGDRVADAAVLVHSGHAQDAVRVNRKAHLALWRAAGRGADATQLEFAEVVIVL